MKTEKPENGGKPWSEWEMTLVVSTLPTKGNKEMLAKQLKRTTGAIDFVWWSVYGMFDKTTGKMATTIKERLGIPSYIIMVTKKEKDKVIAETPEGWKT